MTVTIRVMFCAGLLASLAGCGDTPPPAGESTTTTVDERDREASSNSPDYAPSADVGVNDNGGGAVDTGNTPTQDAAETADTSADSGAMPDAGSGSPDAGSIEGCPDHSRLEGGVGQRLVIETVNFDTDSVVVRNIGSQEVVFSFDNARLQPAWRIYANNAANAHELPMNFPIASGAAVRIHLREAGQNTSGDIYLDWGVSSGADLEDSIWEGGSEVAILSPNDSSSDHTAMEAYVRWGGEDVIGPSEYFRDEAFAGGKWSGDERGDYVFVLEGTPGITVGSNGNVTDPMAWVHEVDSRCL